MNATLTSSTRRTPLRRTAWLTTNSHRFGFTLLELLIVVAIIGLLAGLLLPAIRLGKEAARKTVCLSNLKQLGQAVTLYTETTEGEFFPPLYGVGNPPERLWMSRLLRFGMKERMFYCPSDPNLGPNSTINDPADNLSHGYVLNAFDEIVLPSIDDCVSLRAIREPSAVILASEKNASETDFYMAYWHGEADRVLDQVRHNGRANFGFVDGHVETLAAGRSLAPVNYWTLDGND